jgi:hypothetical protein
VEYYLMAPRSPKPQGRHDADPRRNPGPASRADPHGNNTSSKLDALGIRVAALEGEKDRREGASGVLTTVLKSPLIGWLTGRRESALGRS